MARGTQLYNRPRSPLIHGHSRLERPFAGEWVRGLLLAVVLGWCSFVLWDLLQAGDIDAGAMWAAAGATVVLFAPGAALGSAAGVSLARGFGWKRQWQAAAVVGLLVGGASTWLVRVAGALLGFQGITGF